MCFFDLIYIQRSKMAIIGTYKSNENIFCLNEKLLRIVGFWTLEMNHHWIYVFCYYLYSLMLIFMVFLSYPICEIVDSIKFAENLETIIQNFCMTSCYVSGVIKVISPKY